MTDEDVTAARRRLQGLLEELRACRDAAGQAQDSEKKQDLLDRVVDATSAVLGCRASLPLPVARSILSDNQARRLRDHALCVGDKCNAKGSSTISSLEAHRNRAAKVFMLLQSNATRDQLSQAASTVATHYAACMEWWQKKARRCEMMRSVCVATANLPSATAEMRQVEQAALRLRAGWALNTKFMHLQSRIALAQVTIEPQASTFEAPVKEIVIGENEQVRLLGTFIGDVFPAFLSTGDAVLRSNGRPLDAHHCAVLGGVMERLSEFASALQLIRTKLNDPQAGADLPLEHLGQIVDDVRIIAQEVMHFLALQANAPAIIKGPAVARPPATRRPGPQAVAGVSDSVPEAKILVRSDLGTKKLVSPNEAHASWAADLEIWQSPMSMEALKQTLTLADELLQFDQAGPEARQMKPEDAEHAVGTVVERLQTQATEMQACLAALDDPRRRDLLTPVQMREEHDKTVKVMLSESQRLAKALDNGKAAISIDCMKNTPFPRRSSLNTWRRPRS
ncbi:hypothetical protein [Mesorhizobium onobrychidis]|uniref:Uncharacterized protein n=1 Tax=Mesorhizobium onobrychidis TaxID=2775404 RepID=A0ABY5QYJ3_9HYPH|nr:hypothetical protein [Mesorhizobium onobrychidis]UVC15254.1 hypothetical protein IHQ72_32690 [Mesorhizobium onobrychidis]